MNELSVIKLKRRLSPKLALAFAFGLTVALGGFAAGPARADADDHREHRESRHVERHDHDGGYWGGGGGDVTVYSAPPVVYADPGYYPAPPVVYGPAPGIGFSINIQ